MYLSWPSFNEMFRICSKIWDFVRFFTHTQQQQQKYTQIFIPNGFLVNQKWKFLLTPIQNTEKKQNQQSRDKRAINMLKKNCDNSVFILYHRSNPFQEWNYSLSLFAL